MSLLALDGISARYGADTVVRELNLRVEVAEVVAISGSNGAGKTTTLRAVSGLVPWSGSMTFKGRSLHGARPDAIVRTGIAHAPQGRGTFRDLTVSENLRVGALSRRDDEVDDDVALWFDAFPLLAARRAHRAGLLSGGEQQLLAIARACMSRPTLLMCDEPSAGLAAGAAATVFEVLARLSRDSGMALILVEQRHGESEALSPRRYEMEAGRLVGSVSGSGSGGRP